MRTATKMFAFSGLFSLAVATVYGILSDEAVGTVLLASMFLAPLVMGGFLALHALGAELAADRAEGEHHQESGPIGRFHGESVWPFVMAIGLGLLVQGLVYGQWLIALGTVISALAVGGLMRESRG